jgi:hypothetical protein
MLCCMRFGYMQQIKLIFNFCPYICQKFWCYTVDQVSIQVHYDIKMLVQVFGARTLSPLCNSKGRSQKVQSGDCEHHGNGLYHSNQSSGLETPVQLNSSFMGNHLFER